MHFSYILPVLIVIVLALVALRIKNPIHALQEFAQKPAPAQEVEWEEFARHIANRPEGHHY